MKTISIQIIKLPNLQNNIITFSWTEEKLSFYKLIDAIEYIKNKFGGLFDFELICYRENGTIRSRDTYKIRQVYTYERSILNFRSRK